MCPNCNGEVRLISFITERTSIEQILNHLGEPTVAPPVAPARAPPGSPSDFDQRRACEIGADHPQDTPAILADFRQTMFELWIVRVGIDADVGPGHSTAFGKVARQAARGRTTLSISAPMARAATRRS